MSIKEERVWAGSSTSYQTALDAEDAQRVRMAAGHDDEEEDEGPRLLTVDDGIATISIKGSLVNSDSPWLRYFGVTGYPEIRDALLAAANDAEVKHIVLDVDSGGGAVSGCDDTAKLIRLVSSRVKPVTTFADTMCSAAYWLGSSAGEVYSSKASLVGSIGVISTFREYSEANKMEGINVTVIRAGKHKALANPNEKLTPEARAQIQKVVDSAYTVFVDHVAEMRGKSYEYADKTMADGQEFIGQAAVDVGLTDGITTFDSLITEIKKKIVASEQKRIDNSANGNIRMYGSASTEVSATQPGEVPMAKKALTEADIVALAAGAEAPELNAEIEGTKDPVEPVIEALTPEVDTNAETLVEPKADTMNATVQLLNSQLKEKDQALIEANVKLSKLQDFKDQYEAVLQPLKDIVGRSAHIMHVAQGGSTRDFASMAPADLVAEHARLAVGFSKFPVGGVAAVATEPADQKTQVDPRHLARVNAARFQK